MDIDLLSKMVKELIPDHDRVGLPGFGCFVAEVVPSAFSDRGYTITPPYRRLSFRAGNVSDDTLLADLYASSNGVEPEVAGKIISEFVLEMKKILMVKKTVVFPGLGRMRATRENNFFFVADEDLDIYPEGFGLEPVSLKSHQETREEVSAVISGLQSMIEGNEASVTGVADDAEKPADISSDDVEASGQAGNGTDVSEPRTAEPENEPEGGAAEDVEEEKDGEGEEDRGEEMMEQESDSETVEEAVPEEVAETGPEPEDTGSIRRKLSAWKVVLIVIGSILGLAIVLLVAYVLVAHFCPDFIDSILYDSEQLDVIRYGRS